MSYSYIAYTLDSHPGTYKEKHVIDSKSWANIKA